jgi:DNA-directed RNA polymerase subunit RPC12/RpoP
MAENDLDFVLDGNAAAGALRETFVADMTTADIRCDACGSVGAVGSLRCYAAPMGVVLRCANCGAIVLRAVRTPHGRWLEMRGAHCLRFALS